MKQFGRHARLIIAGICTSIALCAPAATIYDNSFHDLLTRFSFGGREVGDQIVLAGSERYLTTFSFEFYGTNTANPVAFSGSVEARVRFYINDGPLFNGYATPGTKFYDSDWFSVPNPTPRNTFVFTAGSDFPTGGLFIPASEITWSIQFQGMGGTDNVGIDIYSPPVVGGNYPDYWDFDGSSWHLMTNVVPMNFASLMQASQVPEPSSAAFCLLGGLGLLAYAGAFRRK